jgi:Pro-kumamolisin, activation domain
LVRPSFERYLALTRGCRVAAEVCFGSVYGRAVYYRQHAGIHDRKRPRFARRNPADQRGPVVKAQNRSELDALVSELYQKSSPNYEHWLTPGEFKAKFAPTDGQVNTVESFLQVQNLKITQVGPGQLLRQGAGYGGPG